MIIFCFFTFYVLHTLMQIFRLWNFFVFLNFRVLHSFFLDEQTNISVDFPIFFCNQTFVFPLCTIAKIKKSSKKFTSMYVFSVLKCLLPGLTYSTPQPRRSLLQSKRLKRLLSMGSSRWNPLGHSLQYASATIVDEVAGFDDGTAIIWNTASNHASAAIEDGAAGFDNRAAIIYGIAAITVGSAAFNANRRTGDCSNTAYIATGTAACTWHSISY